MSSYNLNEKVGQDYFDFDLDGFKYKMAYPSSKEVMSLQEVAESGEEWNTKIKTLTASLETAPDEQRGEIEAQIKEYTGKAKIAQQTFLDWCMGYVTPELESAPNVKEALLGKNIKYLLAFMNMVQTELGGS